MAEDICNKAVIVGRTEKGGQKAFIYSTEGTCPPQLASQYKDPIKVAIYNGH